jgi:hypothetical protein
MEVRSHFGTSYITLAFAEGRVVSDFLFGGAVLMLTLLQHGLTV